MLSWSLGFYDIKNVTTGLVRVGKGETASRLSCDVNWNSAFTFLHVDGVSKRVLHISWPAARILYALTFVQLAGPFWRLTNCGAAWGRLVLGAQARLTSFPCVHKLAQMSPTSCPYGVCIGLSRNTCFGITFAVVSRSITELRLMATFNAFHASFVAGRHASSSSPLLYFCASFPSHASARRLFFRTVANRGGPARTRKHQSGERRTTKPQRSPTAQARRLLTPRVILLLRCTNVPYPLLDARTVLSVLLPCWFDLASEHAHRFQTILRLQTHAQIFLWTVVPVLAH